MGNEYGLVHRQMRGQGGSVTGLEIAVGYLFAGAVRKANRVVGRADAEVDRMLDAGMERLHDLVSQKLGEIPALRRMAAEVEAGQVEPSERTWRRVQLALEDAAEQDPGFAEALERAVTELLALSSSTGAASVRHDGVAVGGKLHMRANNGSAAAWIMEGLGDVSAGPAPRPGESGRNSAPHATGRGAAMAGGIAGHIEHLHLGNPRTARPDQAEEAAGDPGRRRFLVAEMAATAQLGSTCSLVVSIVEHEPSDDRGVVRAMLVPSNPHGTAVTVVVHPSAGMVAEEALEQVMRVPLRGDTSPVRFAFRAAAEGLQRVRLTVWVGGSFLCELEMQISVHAAARAAGAPHRVDAPIGPLEAAPGEVTLQITTIEGRPAFQIISEPYLGRLIHSESLIGSPGDAVERALATLRDLAVGRSPYSAGTARRWMEEVGTGLWRQMVPDVIKNEFWQLRDRITTFTIAADDNIPWELLYPLAPGHDEGFLVEGFPVLRRARGQGRARTLRLSEACFVVSAKQPKTAAEEIAAIQSVIGSGTTVDSIEGILETLDHGDLNVAHFACHNTFQPDGAGSRIDMVDGPLVPGMLNRAAMQRTLARRSPIIFLNACRSAGAVPEYTQMMGWAQQFLSAGAGAFLGTLWAVRSDKAASFATKFYAALTEGQPLGQAVLTARRDAAAGDGDPTWLAYTVYGDPAATT
ncbi:CHAT domain-containing protein [Kitasatospora griseola]|uniref:CHAT domain-containing protein n=1 Tax=Kitasatospora griseola TaxID=2064 RepID=UPI0036DBC9E6